MKTLALFNNKGGVGKTTLLCNIASFYKKKLGKEVLVIDADPQCNATTYLLTDDELQHHFYEAKTPTIYDYLEVYQSGEDLRPASIIHSSGFDVDLLLGDTRLALIEDFLSGEWANQSNAVARSLKTICFFRRLFDENSKYDYIFIDVGPSLGILNRLVILFSDYFIMPMSSDIFCLRAIENISKSLSKWIDLFNKLQKEYINQKGVPYTYNNNAISIKPLFLGYVNQQYTSRTKGGKKQAVKAYEEIISQIPQMVLELMKPYYPSQKDGINIEIGNIPNFNSLIPMSQTAHKPAFCLDSKDGILGAHFAKVDEFESVIASVVTNIESNIRTYELAR